MQYIELTDDEYENIGRSIKYREDNDLSSDYDVDIYCSNKFLSLSLLLVFVLIF